MAKFWWLTQDKFPSILNKKKFKCDFKELEIFAKQKCEQQIKDIGVLFLENNK